MLSIKDMYMQTNKTAPYGVDGYQIDKKYVNSYVSNHPQKSQLKKGSYLEDYAKVHGYIPGPGVYNYAKNLWPSKCKIRKQIPPHKKTHIQQIVEKAKKQKQPAPGQYKITKSLKDMEKQRKDYARKKIHHPDRITYLDGVQYEATQTPGVGKYNSRQRPKSSSTYYRKQKPEYWIKKHVEEEKNGKKKRTIPDMGSYNPKQVKSFERKTTKDGQWSRVKRFEKEKSGSGLGPGKYVEMEDWKQKRPKSASNIPYKSVYYH